MADFNIKLNCRIEELQEEDQLIIVRLINHLASMRGTSYQDFALKQLKNISEQNPWVDDIQGFDKETFLKNHPA